MARAVFRLSDFVLSLFLLFVGLNLCLPSGDFHIAELAAGIGFASLGVLVFVFSLSSRLWSWSGLYLPRVLLYSALFVVSTGVFIRRWFRASVAFEKGDWYAVAIGATFLAFLACNAIGYAFWGRRTTKLQEP
jgi:O-antigen/teichoic acid export membrane protein